MAINDNISPANSIFLMLYILEWLLAVMLISAIFSIDTDEYVGVISDGSVRTLSTGGTTILNGQ